MVEWYLQVIRKVERDTALGRFTVLEVAAEAHEGVETDDHGHGDVQHSGAA